MSDTTPVPHHAEGQWPPPAPVVARVSKAHAIAAMVLGIVGLVFCWIPFVGSLLCLLALIFGIMVLVRHWPGSGQAITGVATGGVGLVISILVLVAAAQTADEFDEIIEDSNRCTFLLGEWADTPSGSDAERRAENRYEDAGCGEL